jgi:hypothetical protein
MDETPDEALGPDEDRRAQGGQENDPAALGPPDRQPPPDEDDDDDEVDAERGTASRRGILSGRRLAAAAVAVVLVAGSGAALAFNGDGGGDDDDDDTASSPATADDAAWERIVPGGDCQCADGSEFAFWERRADPTKVVFYLEGGGVCTDATTCAFTGTAGENDAYNWSIEGENPAFPGGGILDFDRPENPFADYSFLYVPSCTGDVYLGDVTREYPPELTVEHKGFVDGTAALSYLAENYPDATQVVVVGKTGGSVAAPVYGGLVADLLPDAQVTVFGAQSGAFPDDPDFNAEILGELWGAYDTMPDWEVNDGLTARDWGIPRFWIQAGLHDPDIVMARFDYAFDPNAAAAVESIGVDSSNLVALIDANEAAIEAAGVVQHSYTAPGREHGILDLDRFYEIEVNGVSLVDWVDALIAGEPLADVHCDDCRTG